VNLLYIMGFEPIFELGYPYISRCEVALTNLQKSAKLYEPNGLVFFLLALLLIPFRY
jgi:hypothetical protein